MKKTALALFASAFVATSASALTVYDNKDSGTQIDFSGSARFKWTSTSDSVNGGGSSHVNQAVRNNGSRFGFKITQQLGGGVYALGRVEWRFRGSDAQGVSSSQHDFDHIYDHQLYAGLGHKQFGELTYGNQTVITDEVKQTDLPNTLSLSDGLLVSGARKSFQYVYKGVEGLKVGAYYGGESRRNNAGIDLANRRKDVVGFGAIYNYKFDDRQSLKTAVGFSRERFEGNSTSSRTDYDRSTYAFGTAYTLDKTTLGVDLERRVTDDQSGFGNKRTEKELRTLAYQRLTDNWNAYTMYAYKTNKLNTRLTSSTTEAKTHQFMLGTEYYVIPKHLKGFVEWQTSRTKSYNNGEKTRKVRNNTTVVGVRVYW